MQYRLYPLYGEKKAGQESRLFTVFIIKDHNKIQKNRFRRLKSLLFVVIARRLFQHWRWVGTHGYKQFVIHVVYNNA
jgi:hypothetical protein